MKHPKTIDDINACWMTEVLRGAGMLRRAKVRTVNVDAIGQGVGFLSGRARVGIGYDRREDGAPTSVVVKLPACVREGVEFAESTRAYEREIRFYREVAPQTPIRVPRSLVTPTDPPLDRHTSSDGSAVGALPRNAAIPSPSGRTARDHSGRFGPRHKRPRVDRITTTVG